MSSLKGGFTLPGESGKEELTLELAGKWGADVIRDSDGTQLSPRLLDAGYDIYSTICVIRDHNTWAKAHPDCLQQTFLCTKERIAKKGTLAIRLMEDFFEKQFKINETPEALSYMQVYDRTSETLLSGDVWDYKDGRVLLHDPAPFHAYTVSFLCYRIWEEINMYNHETNHWTSEPLLPIDPRKEETRDFLLQWMENWCQTHPQTDVVRFTSLFYNFVWIWGSSEKNRNIFTDWGSYDFSVSDRALSDFEKERGYALTAEDFINRGNLQVTHMPPTQHKLDYMDFTQKFVASFGSKLVDIVHRAGKKAYVFYDDSWIGVEPYGPYFQSIGFDGIIKCVFSAFEARMCAGVPVETHELRLHPYLFPVGLGGAPTFMKGGNPTRDAKEYWRNVRRGILRQKIDRLGLGGYLHLVQDFPDFVDYMEKILDEFRKIRALHDEGTVWTYPITVGVLHSWGNFRPWTLSGHFHETYMHTLIHINEALAGLPVGVRFLSFEDIRGGVPADIDVMINAGRMGSAWSGGAAWQDAETVASVMKWTWEGGVFLGVEEPSAVEGYYDVFRMAKVLGVDEDLGARVCHGKPAAAETPEKGLIPEGTRLIARDNVYLTEEDARVLAAVDGRPAVVSHGFGKGKGIYLGGFQYSPTDARFLLNLLLWATGKGMDNKYLTDDPHMECAYYPASKMLVVINDSAERRETDIVTDDGTVHTVLDADETKFISLGNTSDSQEQIHGTSGIERQDKD
ncbi:MAG: 1,3-beta-galactosyl-N-acetylhexosamine phosphorylase [Lachnospiraceae bacterium]|nr:1,3-beta-galactosyl-N-acetylhexosamine phosphorylase [Lachnospiraceae bacterium]